MLLKLGHMTNLPYQVHFNTLGKGGDSSQKGLVMTSSPLFCRSFLKTWQGKRELRNLTNAAVIGLMASQNDVPVIKPF